MIKDSLRNQGIDLIRGLCILAVILLHLNIHFGLTDTFLKELLPKKIFSLLFWSGYYGVVIFFTLSGYLITNSILLKWKTLPQINLSHFYWLRFSRIMPLLLLLILTLSILHFTGVKGFIIQEEKTSLARAIIAALTFHINLLEIQVGYLPASWDILWSISIEETFYLAFPIACLFIKKESHFLMVLVPILLVSAWARVGLFAGNELGDKNHLAYVDCLALGCMAAMVAKKHFSEKALRIWMVIGCCLVFLVVYFKGFIYQSGMTDLGLNVTILAFGIFLILLTLHERPTIKSRALAWSLQWLIQMGRYSYEIYLSHMFVILGGAWAFDFLNVSDGLLIPYLILLILITYLLGYVLFNFFSEPVNLWLRRKIRRNNFQQV